MQEVVIKEESSNPEAEVTVERLRTVKRSTSGARIAKVVRPYGRRPTCKVLFLVKSAFF